LPNGATVDKELEHSEVEYWVSIGMYLAHGFHQLSQVFVAEEMDDAATVPVDEEEEQVEH
jgi:hypothetical protein